MKEQSLKHEGLIGEALLREGILTAEQIEQLLNSQPAHKQRLVEMAVEKGMLTEEQQSRFLAKYFRLPYVALPEHEKLDSTLTDLIPEDLARRYEVVIIGKEPGLVTLAMADPVDIRAVDAVRLATNCRIRKVVAGRIAILRMIDRSYHASARIAQSINRLLEDEVAAHDSIETATPVDRLKLEAEVAPVVQFVNLLLMQAVRERASDIHVEPEESSVSVRLRVDGQLRELSSAPPQHMFHAIVNRIKLLANLDIAERRLPQDGHFSFTVFNKTVDVRLSCLPTIYGEKLVLRILDRSAVLLDLKTLGFEPEMLKTFRKVLDLPHGLIILTGPTGAGKTTTLYAALNTIRTSTKNIVTVEDPVEYQIGKIIQVQTKADIGFTFAAGLRSILRQDPDVIMVGEIRDLETAEICIRSSLTGHLVLSTLHTNDSVSAISRLMDMGIDSYLLTATLSLVMAQRLVRKICEECAAPWEPPEELLRRVQKLEGTPESPWIFRRGKGCPQCQGTGYLGRIAIYEQFVLTESIKRLLADGAKMHQIKKQAQQEGLQTLLQSALHKVRDGVTTLDEAFSVCSTQSEMEEVY